MLASSRRLWPPCRHILPRTPTIRPSPIHSRARAFHQTVPRNNAVLDAILFLPHELVTLVHSQVPWYAAIPLTAFIVRGFLVTTGGLRVRQLTARYVGTQAVRQALAYQKRDQLMQRGGYSNPRQAKKAIGAAIRQETSALDKRWDCTMWAQLYWMGIQLPVFFTMAEVIRKMCGARDGLLAMLFSEGDSDTAHGIDILEASPWYTPSLANEGMLWFPDLLTPDPFLPFAVSAAMFLNVYLSKFKVGGTSVNQPTYQTALRRCMLGLTLLIGPMCQGLPAVLMLYWVSSTTSVMLGNIWLERRYPAPESFVACRRPLLKLEAPEAKPTAKVVQARRFKSAESGR